MLNHVRADECVKGSIEFAKTLKATLLDSESIVSRDLNRSRIHFQAVGRSTQLARKCQCDSSATANIHKFTRFEICKLLPPERQAHALGFASYERPQKIRKLQSRSDVSR
jgi:hypothetical protein